MSATAADISPRIFDISNTEEFNALALEIFYFQAKENPVYAEYLSLLSIIPTEVKAIENIPFLPIELFKTRDVICNGMQPEIVFRSSGTTGKQRSRHLITDPAIYQHSFITCFERFFGPVTDYCILALLPTYPERADSSLVYMADALIKQSNHSESGFYLNDLKALGKKLEPLDTTGQKVLLLGVSYSLLDLLDVQSFELQNTLVMETGGMKGNRAEMIRQELHDRLMEGFGVNTVYSEYGMTELLSQAYSKGNGTFNCPEWMKVLIREVNDPFEIGLIGKTGGINIIDLANLYSCSFIATQDLGRLHVNCSFEVLGRFDNSDLRGCNLLFE